MMAALHGAYQSWDIDQATASVWSHAFQGSSYIVTMQAVEQWISHSPWPPTIADIQQVKRTILERESNVRRLPSPEHVIDVDVAKEAFSRGYIQSRSKLGDDMVTIERKLAGYLRKFPGSIPGVG